MSHPDPTTAPLITRRCALAGAGALALGLAACSDEGGASGDATQERVFTWGVKNTKETLDPRQERTIPGAICECLVSFSQDDGTGVARPAHGPARGRARTALPTPSSSRRASPSTTGPPSPPRTCATPSRRMFVPEQASGVLRLLRDDRRRPGHARRGGHRARGLHRGGRAPLHHPARVPLRALRERAHARLRPDLPPRGLRGGGRRLGAVGTLVGTGPYRLVSSTETGRLARGLPPTTTGGAPALDRLEIVYIDDNNTKMLNYKAGDVDACELDATLLSQYQNDAEVADQIVSYEPMGTCFVNINLSMPEFSVPARARGALAGHQPPGARGHPALGRGERLRLSS